MDNGPDIVGHLRDRLARLETENRTLRSRLDGHTGGLADEPAFLHDVLNATPVGLAVSDRQGRLVYVNHGLCEICQRRREELLGRALGEFLGDEARVIVQAQLSAVFAGGTADGPAAEWPVPQADGRTRWVALAHRLLPGSDGHPLCLTTVADQAERRQAEDDRSRLLEVLNATTDVVSMADPDGTVLYANPAARRFLRLGGEPGQVGGRVPDYHPDWAAKVVLEEGLPTAARTGLWSGETALFDVEKREVPMSQVILAHRDGDGRVMYFSTILRDISQSKNIERALKASEETLRRTVDAIPGIVFRYRLGPEGGESFPFVSRGSESLAGLSPELIRADPGVVWERLEPADVRRLRGLLQGSAERLEPFTTEARLRVAPGREAWLRLHAVPAREADGGTLWYGVATDITDRRQAEEALAESERLYRLLAENSTDLIFRCGGDGKLLYMSPASKDILGYDPAELVGQDARTLMNPEDFSRISATHTPGPDLPETSVLTYRQRRKDGTDVWLEAHVRFLFDPRTREIVETQGSVHDVTERKWAESALRESEARYRIMADSAPVMIWVSDANNDCSYVNRRWLEFTGATEEESLGRRWLEAVHPDDRAWAVTHMAEAVRTHAPLGGEYRLRRHDGEYRWVAAVGVARYNADGEFAGYTGSCVDVTDHKLAEQQRQQVQAHLQHTEKLKSLGVLAGGVAHDFNNLLTSVLGYTDLALGSLPPTSAVAPMLHEVGQAARRAADLTQKLLAYAGKGKLVVRRVNLSALVQDMLSLVRAVISRKARVQTELEHRLPAIEADPTQIQQIVLNLVTNASEALEDREGVITIRTGALRLDRPAAYSPFAGPELPGGEYVFVEVTDTGCGMTEETVAHIFDPFFTTKFTGRGLGLAAVHGIVRGHHGLVRVASAPGQGTAFRVLFPAAAPAPDAGRVGDRPADAEGGTVLVIEDDPAVCAALRRILVRAGFRVLEAEDGPGGLAQVTQAATDVVAVFLDANSPGARADRALAEVRRWAPATPVILLGGAGDPAARASAAGAQAAVSKPFTPLDVLAALQRVLQG